MSTSPSVVYVDASEQIAGRLCSRVSKLLLQGKRVVVVNAEKTLVSGSRKTVLEESRLKLELYSHVNPINGPIHHRRPDNMLRRMVRGMLPHQESKGRSALKRLRVYIGTPEKTSGAKFERFEDAMASRPIPLYTTLGEVAKSIGWVD